MIKKHKVKQKIAVFVLLFGLVASLVGCKTEQTPRGIASAYINGEGQLILQYTDGTEQNLGVVKGQDGEDGEDSKDHEEATHESTALTAAKIMGSAVSVFCEDNGSAGSGVIYRIDKDEKTALIITNYHVVYDADAGISKEIKILLYGHEYADDAISAAYIGGSMQYDIAVLYMEKADLLQEPFYRAVTVADSDLVRVGMDAIAVGNPGGEGISLSSGVVSVDSEQITMRGADEKTSVTFRVMRVDTAVNPGNSGGGLFNAKGEWIGVVNAKMATDSVENIGYAIPSNVARGVADNIIDHCFDTTETSVKRATLGIYVTTDRSQAEYDSKTGYVNIVERVIVHEVMEKGAAVGILQADDVLTAVTVDGVRKEITRKHHAVDAMLDVREGDRVTWHIVRDGEAMELDIVFTAEDLVEY